MKASYGLDLEQCSRTYSIVNTTSEATALNNEILGDVWEKSPFLIR